MDSLDIIYTELSNEKKMFIFLFSIMFEHILQRDVNFLNIT